MNRTEKILSVLAIIFITAPFITALYLDNSNKGKYLTNRQKKETVARELKSEPVAYDSQESHRNRIMPAGMKSSVDRAMNPLAEMIDPYGLMDY